MTMFGTGTGTGSGGEWVQWGQYIRGNSDKFLLVALICGMLAYNLHIIHDKADTAQIQFMNGLISTTFGALVTLVTGLGSGGRATATASSHEDPKTGKTVDTLKVEQTENKK